MAKRIAVIPIAVFFLCIPYLIAWLFFRNASFWVGCAVIAGGFIVIELVSDLLNRKKKE